MRRPWRAITSCLLALAAGLAACNRYNPNDFSPTAPGTANALVLSASATSIPADGFSVATITAQIDPASAPDRRTIVFTTTAGSFVGATDNSGRKATLTADTSGRAAVQLKSETVIETATVDASVSVANQVVVDKRIAVSFVAPGPAELLRISTSGSTAPADGATPIHVFADIAPGLPAAQRTVTFTTTLGSFADTAGAKTTTATADSSNRATADLVSAAAGQARVTATVASTSASTTVSFSPALPDSIVVSTDKAAIKASLDDSTVVTATLLRSPGSGTVTTGTVVSFRVVDPATGKDLNFIIRSITPSNDAHVSQATVIAGNTSFRGIATIQATVAGSTAVGQTNIDVISP
jgi:hypothetical protein